ncbi:MAG: NAD(P)H-binding protein [bacterium]|nr:NAD(P)H-binding protein [bacterium]
MIKKIAVFGATGSIGLPVTKALADAGYQVSVLVRDADKAKTILPENINIVEGNILYHHDLKRFLTGMDAVYCSLNVSPTEDIEDFHIETDGLREIINASLECSVRRIIYLSSILQNYQQENDFDWWVFDVKNEAVNYVRDSGIPYTIFCPSLFMDSFISQNKNGKTIQIVGESRFPFYYISIADYANMVVNSIKVLGNEDREYNIQGLDCYSTKEAANLFVKNYTKEKLRVKIASLSYVRFLGLFDKRKRYKAKYSEALNNYSEIFTGETAWEELGKPSVKLADFARSVN